MAFDEVQFPPSISLGSAGGPGYSTSILVTDSGQEQRIARWSAARRKYDVAEMIKTQPQLSILRDFYIARYGPANGFRYKDWGDYNTTADGSYDADGQHTNADVILGSGNAVQTQYQLVKIYTSGAVQTVRKITKPVSGTVKVALAGVNQTSGFTVDTTTGLLTFTAAPALGVSVTAGFEFDTPARFGDGIDDHIALKIDEFNCGSTSVPITEILDSGEQPDAFFYGGAIELAVAANVQLSAIGARVYVMAVTAGSVIFLPDTTNLAPGGPYFYLVNDGTSSASLTLKTFGGGATLMTIAPGVGVTVILSADNVGTKTWYAF